MNDGKLVLLINRYYSEHQGDSRVHPNIWKCIQALHVRLAKRKSFWLEADERHDAELILNYLVHTLRQEAIKRPPPLDFAKPYTGKTALGQVEFLENEKPVKYEERNNHGKPNRN